MRHYRAVRSRIPIGALGLVTLTLVFAVGTLLVGWANRTPIDVTSIAVITFLAFPAMGLLILRSRPGHPIGWLLVGIGADIYLSFLSSEYAYLALVRHPGVLPFGQAMAWISGWLWIPFSLMVLLFLPMLFPDGRLLSRRWWIVLASGFIFAALAFFGNAFAPGPNTDHPDVINPLGLPQFAPLFRILVNVALLFGLLAVIGSVASVIVRYRRANSIQRRQLRWFLVAVIVAVVPFVLQGNGPAIVVQVIVGVAIPLLPISIAIAVLRYRLYDIDLVINRALVYGILAVFITAVYVGIVVGVGRLIGSANRPNLALSIVATAVIAVAFQPIRERVQRFANRLVYGERATPYEVMAGFADQMGRTLSADTVLPQMAEAAARGVGAQAARVTLVLPSAGHRSTIWPADAGDGPFSRLLPVSFRGEPVGEIAVRENPGQPITPGEGRLLADLAAQAGLVLHNVRLTAELQARLADLSAQAVELRASRQRIVMAQATERRRLGGEIRTGVQRELEATAEQLDEVERLLGDDGATAAARLEALTNETQHSLDGLRELARGIFPALLRDQGLIAALRSQLMREATPISLEGDRVGRYPPEVEAAIYFCCLQVLDSARSGAAITIHERDGQLVFSVNGVALGPHIRVQDLEDRISASGGSLSVDGDTISGKVPIRPAAVVA
jgi:signal transduction histidine kinase